MLFMPSRLPQAHQAVIRQPREKASPKVSWSFKAKVSLTTVFDVATKESWSRYVMFRDMFSSAN
jgi:hypothetical protein